MNARDDEIYHLAKKIGCNPVQRRGSWNCGCGDNPHGFDQQCPLLTKESLLEQEAAYTKKVIGFDAKYVLENYDECRRRAEGDLAVNWDRELKELLECNNES